MKRLLMLLSFTIIFIPIYAQSLDRAWALKYEILDKLIPIIGDSSMVREVVEMDTVMLSEYTKDEFTDPYGTLKGCTLFSVGPKAPPSAISNLESGSYWFGIYKNGEVIWLSDSSYSEEPLGSNFISTLDVNKDGNVEIINQLTETDIYEELNGYLYIISWDGQTGKFINEGGKHSIINNYKGLFKPIDLNNDGIYEFESDTWQYNGTTDEWDSTKIVCCWNGEKYGIFSDCPQYPTPITYPPWPFTKADDFNAQINTSVIKIENMYEFRTVIHNSSNSKQNIKSFYFDYPFENIYHVKSLERNLNIFRLSNYSVIGLKIISDSLQLFPGDSLTFIYRNKYLPKIAQCYLQAPFKSLKFLGTDIIQTANYYDNNVLHNSVKKKTLAPAEPPKPFILNDFLDTLTTYADSSYALGWITDEQTRDKYDNYFNTAKAYLEQGDSSTARAELQKVLTDCNADSSTVLTSEAYALLYFNTEYLINKLPEGEPGLPVKLEDSQGNLLQGGSLQYYDGGWKDATDNGDGTFTVQTDRSTVSLKMHYAGGSQQKDNVPVGADTAVFQTSDVTVKLLSSQNTLLDSGFVQYYASGWQDFGSLVNGVVHKELLSKNYNFKMKYAGSEKNHVQNLDTNTTVTFHTVNAEVQLRDSQNNLLPGGTVEYYASGWKNFGEAANGKVNKELLSRAYTFKMHYANAENNLVQDLDSSTVVVFHTVNTTVQLKDSQENFLNGDSVKYYASGWQYFGIPANGSVSKELLPKQYNFKMYYGGADKNIVQNLDTSTTVTFHTVKTEVQLRDSQGNLLNGGFAKYYASGWKDFGEAINGIAQKELLSRAYTFKIQYGGADMNHVQNLDTNTTVVFNTINVTTELRDSQGNLLNGGTVEYYANGWKNFGEAVNGTVNKELLPRTYTFKMNHGGINTTKEQDVSAGSTVTFNTTLTTVRVTDNQNQPIENAEVFYYGGGWQQIGFTNSNGEITKELLARSINFKAKKNNKEKNKLQDTTTNSVIEITLE